MNCKHFGEEKNVIREFMLLSYRQQTGIFKCLEKFMQITTINIAKTIKLPLRMLTTSTRIVNICTQVFMNSFWHKFDSVTS